MRHLIGLITLSVFCFILDSCKPSTNGSSQSLQNNSVQENSVVRNGGWSPWQDYTYCGSSSTKKTQLRFCNNPSPTSGGANCVGEAIREVLCNEVGQFSSWQNVGGCNSQTGQQKMTRVCISDAPIRCVGEVEKYEPCLVNGGYGPFYRISSCSASGSETWRSDCNNPLPRNGGTCSGLDPKIETRACTPVANPTVNATAYCPSGNCQVINGGWGAWTTASACDFATAKLMETRLCNNPIPSYGGAYCIGSSSRLVSCTPGCVCSDPRYVGSCDGTTTERIKITTCSGVTCPELEKRETVLCPIDCVWGGWEIATPCHNMLGTQTIRRVIERVGQNGGALCGTPETKSISCPINGDCL